VAGPAAGLPRPDHVVIVIFENKAYEQVAGSADAPYLNALAGRAAVFTDAHAVTHPSQPNYLALFSGSTHGVTDDGCPVRLGNEPNLARQLLDAGLTFVGYSEDLPAAGYHGCSQGRYAAKHNPWADFGNVPDSANQPLTDLPADAGRLPTVSVIVPNICDDMHDCPIGTGDAWARAHLDGYLRWADSHHGLLVVTFDEDDNGPANHILTLAAGPMVRPGRYPEPVDHFRLLRTVETLYGLAPLGQAADTGPVTDIWR
jgi:acid phosphatase